MRNEPRQLASFWPELAHVASVQKQLKKKLGQSAPEILAKLQLGVPLMGADAHAYDVMTDFLHERGKPVHTIKALGESKFDIQINNLGPCYWISAAEFDHTGYFSTATAAIGYAEFDFEPFITGYRDSWNGDDDE